METAKSLTDSPVLVVLLGLCRLWSCSRSSGAARIYIQPVDNGNGADMWSREKARCCSILCIKNPRRDHTSCRTLENKTPMSYNLGQHKTYLVNFFVKCSTYNYKKKKKSNCNYIHVGLFISEQSFILWSAFYSFFIFHTF